MYMMEMNNAEFKENNNKKKTIIIFNHKVHSIIYFTRRETVYTVFKGESYNSLLYPFMMRVN